MAVQDTPSQHTIIMPQYISLPVVLGPIRRLSDCAYYLSDTSVWVEIQPRAPLSEPGRHRGTTILS